MSEIDWYLQINLKARQLRLLVALDAHRNLTQVAEATHVSVPAVSKSLAELERGLGLVLFTRTSQGLVPTPYGECLTRHAKGMLTALQQARDELKALRSGVEGKIRVGMLPASAAVLLPKALELLKRRSPGTNVQVIEGTTTSLLPELWQGRLDLFVGRLPRLEAQNSFEEKELVDAPVTLVTGQHHPLATRRRVQWKDLRPYPWILPPPGSIMREPLERVLEANDLPLTNNYIETLSIHVARAQLHVSNFIAVMAGTSAADPAQPLHILPLRLPQLLRPAGVLWNRHRGLTPSAQRMVACLEEAASMMRGVLEPLDAGSTTTPNARRPRKVPNSARR